LNVTALYLGVAGAGSVGGLVLTLGGVEYMGLICGLIEALALVLALLSIRTIGPAGQHQQEVIATLVPQESAEIGNQ
jgi:predicted MFS family arabinose efflux permease